MGIYNLHPQRKKTRLVDGKLRRLIYAGNLRLGHRRYIKNGDLATVVGIKENNASVLVTFDWKGTEYDKFFHKIDLVPVK